MDGRWTPALGSALGLMISLCAFYMAWDSLPGWLSGRTPTASPSPSTEAPHDEQTVCGGDNGSCLGGNSTSSGADEELSSDWTAFWDRAILFAASTIQLLNRAGDIPWDKFRP